MTPQVLIEALRAAAGAGDAKAAWMLRAVQSAGTKKAPTSP